MCFALKLVLDRAGWRSELQAELDMPGLLVYCQVFDKATLDNIHSKIWVDDLGQCPQHICFFR